MKHFLNEIQISPRNQNGIGVVSNFTGNPDELALNVDTLILPRESFDIVKNHIATIGLFEGIPYRVQMANGVNLAYYVDLTENPIFRQHECELKIKKRGENDQFFDNANGTSFELLKSKGINFNTFNVPYIILKDNQVELAISLGISLFIMTKELIQSIKDLATTISQGVQASVPNAGVPPSIDLGDIIAFALNIASQVIYIASLLVAVIKLSKEMFELIFPPVRNLLGCKEKELLSKGCQYLGFEFESSLLDGLSGATILPVPLIRERKSIFKFKPNLLNNSFNKGYPTASDTTPTLGSLFTALETKYNAKTVVRNGVVRLERRDWWQNLTLQQLNPSLSLQSERDDAYSYNVGDVWKRYYIHYQIDYTDSHTADEIFDFHDAEYSTEPLNVVNADLVTIKGLNDVNIPFALGARKDELNWLEKLAKAFFDVVDDLTGIFGGGTQFASKIEARIGVLTISQQFFSITKSLYTVNGKQPANFMDFVSAKTLQNKFHYINQIQLNGWKLKTDVRIRLRESDFVYLLNSNYAEIDGLDCELVRMEWVDEQSLSVISYNIPDNYAVGKVKTLTINE